MLIQKGEQIDENIAVFPCIYFYIIIVKSMNYDLVDHLIVGLGLILESESAKLGIFYLLFMGDYRLADWNAFIGSGSTIFEH